MNLDFPAAMDPFLTSDVIVRVSGRDRSQPADAVRIAAASVRAGNPDANRTGAAGSSEQWVVSFRADAWISPHAVSKGSVVEADAAGGRWPVLTVQRVQTLAGMCVLECSARERGGRP